MHRFSQLVAHALVNTQAHARILRNQPRHEVRREQVAPRRRNANGQLASRPVAHLIDQRRPLAQNRPGALDQ